MSTPRNERPARSRAAAVAVAAFVGATALSAPVPAGAGGRAVNTTGGCSGRGTWAVKVTTGDRGGLQAEFDLDVNRAGQRWQVRFAHDGKLVANVVRTTRAPSGAFTLRVVTPNAPGADRFSVRAQQINGPNSCRGHATF